jgi:23S rRNA pseudouridine1911/1915/1917 synthase
MFVVVVSAVASGCAAHIAGSAIGLRVNHRSPCAAQCCATEIDHALTTEIEHELLRWHTSEPPPLLQHIVSASEEGHRLPQLAGSCFPALGSKSQAERAVKRGALRLNDAAVETSRRVRGGDVLTLQLPAAGAPSKKRLQAMSRFVAHLRSQGLRACYEDEHLAVVYKPPGIHTKAGTNRKYAALEDALPAELSPPRLACGAEMDDALSAPLVMHRLDVPVSGLCLVAKTRAAARHLAAQFEQRRVVKTYHALLVGDPAPAGAPAAARTISAPVDGMAAETEFDVLDVTPHAQWGTLSTVRLRPKTGRTHQLRIHAAAELGCPIVGDDLYWPAAASARAAANDTLPALRKSGGLFLQSCAVAFENLDGTQVEVMVPEAPKFAALRTRASSGAAWTG